VVTYTRAAKPIGADVRIEIGEDITDASNYAAAASINPCPREESITSSYSDANHEVVCCVISSTFLFSSLITRLQMQSWKPGQPYVHYLDTPKEDPWLTLKRGVDQYDDAQMCKAWKDDLETMLIFVRFFGLIPP